MEKRKSKFKVACYLVLGYVALSLIDLIVSVINKPDLKALYGEAPENLLEIAWIVTLAAAFVSILLHVWLAGWGLKNIKNESTGIGHSVLEFFLSIVAFFNLYEVFELIAGFSAENAMLTVWNIAMAVIWIAVLLIYDWNAIVFRRECLAKAK